MRLCILHEYDVPEDDLECTIAYHASLLGPLQGTLTSPSALKLTYLAIHADADRLMDATSLQHPAGAQ